MELLKKLTPAETYFIMHRGAISHKDYLRWTLLDLILKGVLQIKEVEKQASSREKHRYLSYVLSGSNLSYYRPLPHEKPLLKSFKFGEEMQVQFRNFISITRSKTHNYKELIFSSPNVSGYFTQNFFQKYFSGDYSLNSNGQSISKKLNDLFNQYEVWLSTPGNENKYPDIAQLVGNNIILLPSFTLKLFSTIDFEFKKQNATSPYTYNDSEYNWWYMGDIIFGGDTGGFDATFHSFDSDSSGCSGGSGCSGCGGGGCGGCGGD